MNNRMLHTIWYRQRLTLLAYGHAMPSALLLCGDITPIGIAGFNGDAVLIAPITFVAHGNNVPISRGDPPISQE
jgi:hypothetical protein